RKDRTLQGMFASFFVSVREGMVSGIALQGGRGEGELVLMDRPQIKWIKLKDFKASIKGVTLEGDALYTPEGLAVESVVKGFMEGGRGTGNLLLRLKGEGDGIWGGSISATLQDIHESISRVTLDSPSIRLGREWVGISGGKLGIQYGSIKEEVDVLNLVYKDSSLEVSVHVREGITVNGLWSKEEGRVILSGRLNVVKMRDVKRLFEIPWNGFTFDGEVSGGFEGRYDRDGVYFKVAFDLKKGWVAKGDSPILQGVEGGVDLTYKDGNLIIGKGRLSSPYTLSFSGELSGLDTRIPSVTLDVQIPPLHLDALKKGFLALIPSLKTVDVEGEVGGWAKVRFLYGQGYGIAGGLTIKDARVAIAEGRLVFERLEGDIPVAIGNLIKEDPSKTGRISIGGVSYGPFGVTNLTSELRFEDNKLWFYEVAFDIYGGRGTGVAYTGMDRGYLISFSLQDVSLQSLCDSFPPIKGYLSGLVDGRFGITGEGLEWKGIKGVADFSAKGSPQEPMRISNDFIQKLGGPQARAFMWQPYRPYDKGVLRVFLQNGYAVFNTLEVSHTTFFGIKDLDIKVAPVHNKIGLDHLIWSIGEASERMGR
ncbi:MAG: hypothetical protein HY878_00600, partial [Deltaproteobacteria bacterium]|nr:hypothetical protein [Deltaproteobacteria bacterium]